MELFPFFDDVVFYWYEDSVQFRESGFVRVLIIKARYSLLKIIHKITKSR